MKLFVPLRMTVIDKKKGFSLLEMVIAIFIIAVVLAFSLIVMGKGMGVSAKSNDMSVATAIAEQEMARVKNIPFPPTTVNKQDKYEYPYLPLTPGSWTPAPTPYNLDFESRTTIVSYANDPSSPISNTDYDNIMLRKIVTEIRRTRDQKTLVNFVTYIARNGTI